MMRFEIPVSCDAPGKQGRCVRLVPVKAADARQANVEALLLASVIGYTGVRLFFEEPRKSPRPCCDGCPGWCVSEVDRCTAHGGTCNGYNDDCSTLNIERCDGCWHGIAGAPDDEEYQDNKICQAALKGAQER